MKGFSCLGAAVHCVQDDSGAFGMYVRRSTAAQYAATKVTTEYLFNVQARLFREEDEHKCSQNIWAK